MITLELPYPPTFNTYWRHVVVGRTARVYISKKGKAYRRNVCRLCYIYGFSDLNLTGRLSVAMYATMPDRRVRDLDNLPKAVLDSITAAGVWDDDGQIDFLSVKRCGIKKGGKIVVEITELE